MSVLLRAGTANLDQSWALGKGPYWSAQTAVTPDSCVAVVVSSFVVLIVTSLG
jgi:hypothetical protein